MSESNGQGRAEGLVLKDQTFYVDEDAQIFIARVQRERQDGSLRLHFRKGRLTKPILWTEKKTLD